MSTEKKKRFGKREDGSVPHAMSWEDLKYVLQHEMYHVLGRSEAELRRYRTWRAALTKCYKSATDHLANVVYGYPVYANEEGLFEVQVPPEDQRRTRYILRENDFPYFVKEGIHHSVLWAEVGQLPDTVIREQLSRLLPGCPFLFFTNPPTLQSVPRFKHCHVFWRQRHHAADLAVEVCVDSVASAKQAQLGGTDRLELCSALSEGGLTPTVGLAKVVLKAVSIPVFALIRPRAGDFLYSKEEVETMVEDIAQLRACGVHGFVIGALTSQGDIDVETVQALLQACDPCPITFHRAFDMARDMHAALHTLGTAFAGRITRVLTSGGRASALEGAPVICALAEGARRANITLVAGGGISEDNVERIARQAGVVEVHCSARASVESGMEFRNTGVHMGAGMHASEFSLKQASPQRVSAIKTAFTATSSQ